MQGIKNVLSRNELKSIMAGSGGGGCMGSTCGFNIFCCGCPGFDSPIPAGPFFVSCDGNCPTLCESLGLGDFGNTGTCADCGLPS